MSKTRSDADVRGRPYLATLLATTAGRAEITDLHALSQLSLDDFHKQLAWEIRSGLVVDDRTSVLALPAADARA